MINRLSATEIVAKIKSGELRSREVTEHFIARIEAVNPKINAVVIDFFERARAAADAADTAVRSGDPLGQLHGLPFTIKECFDFEDSPSTLGVLARKNDRPTANDKYVAALEAEGGIVLGKTNVPQLLIFIEAENRVYGRTNNPINRDFSCGGSSGGEGAIVGAGGSPVGVGSDIGGSVRFPAAFCGACSIKPTMWRTPDLTRYGETILEGPINSVAGVIANHADDLELFLTIMNEAIKSRPIPPVSEVETESLRVGYFVSDGMVDPAPAIGRGVLESAETLRESGVDVVEFKAPSFEFAEEIFYRLLTVNEGKIFTDVLGHEPPMPQLKNLMTLLKAGSGTRSAARTIAKAFGQRSLNRVLGYFGGKGDEFIAEWARRQEEYRQEFLTAMDDQGVDAILSPVCALPAFLHRSTDKVGLGGTYTLLYNVLGFPSGVARVSTVGTDEAVGRKAGADLAMRAISKAEEKSAGLPVAVQIAARPWREDIVLKLIGELHRTVSRES